MLYNPLFDFAAYSIRCNNLNRLSWAFGCCFYSYKHKRIIAFYTIKSRVIFSVGTTFKGFWKSGIDNGVVEEERGGNVVV